MLTYSSILAIYAIIAILWVVIFIMEIFSTDTIVLYAVIAIFIVTAILFLFIHNFSRMLSFPDYYQAVYLPALLVQWLGSLLFMFMLLILLFGFVKAVFLTVS